ncbi:histidine--tRNA ligase [Enterococcus canintestini]|uniref:Histidine--tRNA ligase n=1 Tax=Enterococcus canintestini TaxID=317010 RepID=A0A267HNC2_9ENTE|nr:histidine--tRNA ligase [Enterococcus canintestini]PAA99815.1 histidyl-tRNA synthase [Enterococcus canintestini]
MKYQKPKGTMDILPGNSAKWQYIEDTARKVFGEYNFRELRTPIFEHFEVVARSVGETTDIVTKEMYDFFDKGERHITLRPEGTAPLVRSYVENKLFGPEHINPFKGYYVGPMFRYERPQAGRLRQFHQIGVEVIGSKNPATDVETMAMALDFYQKLGVSQVKLVINTLGNKESRLRYRDALIAYLETVEEQLSEDSKRRLHQNPLRVLDSKDKKDKAIVENAPSILDYLDEYSATFFNEVKGMLDALNIPFVVDHRMVRGLDYYNHTVFEIMSEAEGFGGVLTTICAGGRYDGLISEFGGPVDKDTGFGFALGIERALIAVEAEGKEIPVDESIDVYVACMDQLGNVLAQAVAQSARHAGLTCERDIDFRKLKAQFRTANRLGAKLVVVIGDNEVEEQKVVIKDMEKGTEEKVAVSHLNDYFKNYSN